jgi:hypothetical protein
MSGDEEEEEGERGGFGASALSRERLLVEVETLCRERDGLIGQLRDSTKEFQEQMKSIEERCKLPWKYI